MNPGSETSRTAQQADFSIPAAGEGGSLRHQAGKKMICLDVDGTIVNHDGLMSSAVREAGRAVVAAGHTVVVSTGRSLPATLPVVEKLGITQGFGVCSNGGVTLRINTSDPQGYSVISQKIFDPSQALAALKDRLPTARYAVETAAGHFLSTERFEDMTFGVAPEIVSHGVIEQSQAVRLVVNSDDATAQEFARAVREVGLHGVTYAVGWSAWLDISAAGVTKASSLEELRKQLGVDPEQTVACGDGRNDIEMLDWAHRGVAMGQSVPEVVAAADEVTGTVEEDGLVTVLRSILEQG